MENLEPKTRLEQFLSAIAGNDIELPEVKTRLEYFLKEIAENGGENNGGNSGANGLLVNIVNENETVKLDKNYQEITAYLERGNVPVFKDPDGVYSSFGATGMEDDYYIVVVGGRNFVASSPTADLVFYDPNDPNLPEY